MTNYLYEYPEKNVLLLPGNTLADRSYTPKALTVAGNTTVSSAQYKFYGSSLAFDGTGDFITLADGNSYLDFTQPFTIEMWIRQLALTTQERELWSIQYSGSFYGHYIICYNGNARLDLCTNEHKTTWGPQRVAINGLIQANTWHHLAFSRTNSNLYAFLDGQLIQQTPITETIINSAYSTASYIGTYSGASVNSFNGNIQDIRFTNGLARYTSNFTPPRSFIQTINGKVDMSVPNPITRVKVKPRFIDQVEGIRTVPVSQVVPDVNGNWSTEIQRGKFDISYFNNVDPPRIDGPYDYTEYET